MNIFTDVDTSIELEGARDGFGLEVLWTQMGQKIFKSKLTRVAYNLRMFTISFCHVLWAGEYLRSEGRNELFFKRLNSGKDWDSEEQLKRSLVTCMENLLAFSLHKTGDSVPGSSKAAAKLLNNEKFVLWPSTAPDKMLLVNQTSVGLLGRHKGPMQRMKVLEQDSLDVTSQAAEFFNDNLDWQEFKKLREAYYKVLDHLFKQKEEHREVQWDGSDGLFSTLVSSAAKCFGSGENIPVKVRKFWEERIFGSSRAAVLLSEAMPPLAEDWDWNIEFVFKKALSKADAGSIEKGLLQDVVTMEPLLSLSSAAFSLLTYSGATRIDDVEQELTLLHKKIKAECGRPEVQAYVKNIDDSGDVSGFYRLLDLGAAKNNKMLAGKIFKQHTELMKRRGRMPWIIIRENEIKHTGLVSRELPWQLERLKNGIPWTHDYYLGSLAEILKGIGGRS